MMHAAGDKPRRVRGDTYVFFLVCFAAILFLSHLSYLKLPYYWDEAGQFIPTARDIYRHGSWIAHSAPPNIHPPVVAAYLAAAWKLEGYYPAVTRSAMLALAALALLAAFLLAIELSQGARGMPAFLAAALLCASPLFFAQSVMAQLDAPAMLFTAVALLWFLQNRIAAAAAACVLLVLVKETGIVVPLTFAGWLAYERRWREAAYFLAPVAALGGWIFTLERRTGHWTGSADSLRYNLYYPFHPIRLAVAFLRRLYTLFFADFHWVGTTAIVLAWRKRCFFQTRSWRIAWLVVAVHVVMLTFLGGAVLERYLLPAWPIVYAAMALGISRYPRIPRLACSAALLGGVAAGHFINPPYPFPYDDNPSFTDFVRLHADAAGYLERFYPAAQVSTAWPLTLELAHPELGYVSRPMAVRSLPNLSARTLDQLDWQTVDVLVVYSRTWDPPWSLMRYGPVAKFWSRFFGYVPEVSSGEATAQTPFPLELHLDRHGQWVDVYVNPRIPRSKTLDPRRAAPAQAVANSNPSEPALH